MKPTIITLLVLLLSKFGFATEINPIETTSEDYITHEVFFATDKFDLSREESQKLAEFVKQIKNIAIDRISIRGFCDDRGTNNYNKVLSNKRAETIKQIIANFKINQKVIKNVTGEGEVALTNEEQALFNQLRSLNRKVVIVVAPRKKVADSFYADELQAGQKINIENIKFKLGYRYLANGSAKTLSELADFLVKRTDIYFTVLGHVCCTKNGRESRDRETKKMNLSVVRAKYIRDYLVKRGVDPSRVKYKGMAGKYNTGVSAQQDRRVELVINKIG